jgi:RNA polymerase sigma-70 factor (sigma-E family)
MTAIGDDAVRQLATTVEPTPPAADFATFYAAAWPDAVRLAAILTQRRAIAEDLAQEAMTRVYLRWDQVRIGAPGGYLRTTVVNACNNWHRHNKTEREKLPRLVDLHPVQPESEHLADAIAELPFRQRAALVLRFYEACSEAEIAEILGCRPGTVKSLTSRALAQLQKVIER